MKITWELIGNIVIICVGLFFLVWFLRPKKKKPTETITKEVSNRYTISVEVPNFNNYAEFSGDVIVNNVSMRYQGTLEGTKIHVTLKYARGKFSNRILRIVTEHVRDVVRDTPKPFNN